MNTDFVTSAGYFNEVQAKDRSLQGDPKFSLRDAVRKLLAQLHVQTYDCNCVPENGPAGFPVRLKADKSAIEYYNGTTWVAAP